MIVHTTCHWCQKPIELGIICWKHTDGLAYAWDGHAATPDRNKPPHRAASPAPNGRFSYGHKKFVA